MKLGQGQTHHVLSWTLNKSCSRSVVIVYDNHVMISIINYNINNNYYNNKINKYYYL